MKDIEEVAKLAADAVVNVAFSVSPWDGSIVFADAAMGHACRNVMPSSYVQSARETTGKIHSALSGMSIKCRDGRFVAKRTLGKWHGLHESAVAELAGVRDWLLRQGSWIADAAKAEGRRVAISSWKASHPSDEMPPPAAIVAVQQNAASAVPKPVDIVQSFVVDVRYCCHPFSFMSSGAIPVSRDMLVAEAWHASKELLVANYVSFACNMKQEVDGRESKERFDAKVVRIGRVARRFLDTELVGDIGSIQAATALLDMVDGEGAASLDPAAVDAAVRAAWQAAARVDSVNSLLGAT